MWTNNASRFSSRHHEIDFQEAQPSARRTSMAVSGLSALNRRRNSRAQNATEHPGGSENGVASKLQHLSSLGGGVLSDVTNMKDLATVPPEEAKPGMLVRHSGRAKTLPSACNGAATVVSEYDAKYKHDPQHATEYTSDINRRLKRDEMLNAASPTYMERQVQVDARMRGVLVDWLISVGQKYKLKSDTLFLAVDLIDRFLSVKIAARHNLQLIGITALFIAAKFEEIYPPKIDNLVWVTDKAYSKEDIVKMEVHILSTLNFKVCRPTPMHFLDYYHSLNKGDEIQRSLSEYLLELSLCDYTMIRHAPSHLAAAAVLLTNSLLQRHGHWDADMAEQTRFSERMLEPCTSEMQVLLRGADSGSLKAAHKKFSQLQWHSVAKMNLFLGRD